MFKLYMENAVKLFSQVSTAQRLWVNIKHLNVDTTRHISIHAMLGFAVRAPQSR